MMKRSIRFLFATLLLTGCSEDPVPKPRGWFRIDLPEKSYAAWGNDSTFKAEIPVYARMAEREAKGEARWLDLRFPKQRATVHMTWSPVNGRLAELIEDAHVFKSQHESKAARIRSDRILRDSVRVFGTMFDVEGDVASPLVFYLTDSTDNFLYGSLYYDARPNADSAAPVTERIRQDMRHFAVTLRWR